MKKFYLGDAVYVEVEDHALVLTTEDGINITNRIVLEPKVLVGFLDFIGQLAGKEGTE